MNIKKYPDESCLWRAFLDGDTDAYSEIFNRYVRVMFVYGSRFCGDRETVKDCIQDVFVRMHLNRGRLGATDNIKYYLFGAMRNSLMNALKKDSRRNALHEAFLTFDRLSSAGQTSLLELREDESIVNARLSQLLSTLGPRQKQIMYYRYVENLSVTEISDMVNISYQAVLNTIQRAIKKIRATSN